MKIKLNVAMLGYKIGDVIDLKTKKGVVIDKFWRNRIKDSRIDKCVTIITAGKKSNANSKA